MSVNVITYAVLITNNCMYARKTMLIVMVRNTVTHEVASFI